MVARSVVAHAEESPAQNKAHTQQTPTTKSCVGVAKAKRSVKLARLIDTEVHLSPATGGSIREEEEEAKQHPLDRRSRASVIVVNRAVTVHSAALEPPLRAEFGKFRLK